MIPMLFIYMTRKRFDIDYNYLIVCAVAYPLSWGVAEFISLYRHSLFPHTQFTYKTSTLNKHLKAQQHPREGSWLTGAILGYSLPYSMTMRELCVLAQNHR